MNSTKIRGAMERAKFSDDVVEYLISEGLDDDDISGFKTMDKESLKKELNMGNKITNTQLENFISEIENISGGGKRKRRKSKKRKSKKRKSRKRSKTRRRR